MHTQSHRRFSWLWQYSKALWSSFYSSVLYMNVVKHWRGLGVGYLFFLILLGATPLSLQTVTAFDHFFKEKLLFPLKALPVLTIQQGEMTFHQPMPYLIKNAQGAVVSIIDTTGTVSEMNQAYPDLAVLITKHKLDYRPASYKQFLGLAKDAAGNKIYTHPFEQHLNGQLSGAKWIQTMNMSKLNTLMQILTPPCILLFYFVFFSVMLLILSVLVPLYADVFFNLKVPFKSAYRLSAIAATPALVLFFFIQYNHFKLFGVIYAVLFFSYISYGLYSIKRQERLNFVYANRTQTPTH